MKCVSLKSVKTLKQNANALELFSLWRPQSIMYQKQDSKNYDAPILLAYHNNFQLYEKFIYEYNTFSKNSKTQRYLIIDDNENFINNNLAKRRLIRACNGNADCIKFKFIPTSDVSNMNIFNSFLLEMYNFYGMKFKYAIMNPPWGESKDKRSMYPNLAEKILENTFNYSNEIICLMPNTALTRCNDIGPNFKRRQMLFKHCDKVIMYNPEDFPDIAARTKFMIAHFLTNQTFDMINIDDHTNSQLTGNRKLQEVTWLNKELSNWLNNVMPVIDDLNNKYGTMMPKTNIAKNNQWEYFENRQSPKFPNHTIKDAKDLLNRHAYKYMLSRSTFENFSDPIYESFKSSAPCTWLMNKKNIQQNMKYWLSENCKFIFLYRKCVIGGTTAACHTYGIKKIPAANFDMPEDEFKEWANNLYKFNDQEYNMLYKSAKNMLINV